MSALNTTTDYSLKFNYTLDIVRNESVEFAREFGEYINTLPQSLPYDQWVILANAQISEQVSRESFDEMLSHF